MGSTMFGMSTVRRLDELGRDDVALAGGKGANLGELTRSGVPVPPGVVLTTTAYRDFVDSTGIGKRVLALAAVPRDAQPAAYESAAASIQDVFASVDVPQTVVQELREVRGMLGEGQFAVRSSATAEDLAGASFAGQQDTYLDVRGEGALLSAVRSCWASLWTARAMAYRARQGIEPGAEMGASEHRSERQRARSGGSPESTSVAVSLAVVVQQMVDADAAGVMFTANPANGRRDETLISAAWGLGESVVGGSAGTDEIIVAMPEGRVRSRTTAHKAVMTVATGGDTAEHAVPVGLRDREVLDDEAAVELARWGARIEDLFGTPQDVEWARADGVFWIVQARAVTALPEPEAEPPTDWSVPDPKDAYYMRASIVEQLPDPLSPLFADLVDGSVTRSLQALFREFVGENVVREGDVGLPTVNGYAYYRYSRSGLWRITLRSPAALRTLLSPGAQGARARWRTSATPGTGGPWSAGPRARLRTSRCRSSWMASASCSTPPPRTTPPSRRSSRSP
jgi:rifampicin phosphotransferase